MITNGNFSCKTGLGNKISNAKKRLTEANVKNRKKKIMKISLTANQMLILFRNEFVMKSRLKKITIAFWKLF